MKSIIYTGIMTVLWIVNLFNGTGLDTVYHVTQYAKYISLLLMAIMLILKNRGKEKLLVKKKDFYAFFLMALVFIISSVVHGYGTMAIDYLWVYCLVFLIALLPIDEKTIRFTGYIYGVAGLVVLYIYDYGTFFSGWNENSIAMLGTHSFLIFIVPFYKESRFLNKLALILGTIVFSILISPTDSRSGILFAIVGALFAFSFIPRKWMFNKNSRTILVLLIPLVIAIIVSIISNTSVFGKLEAWSLEQFNKPIFNGRDDFWSKGFKVLFSDFFFGTGNLNKGAYHNSAITCLVAYGTVGFGLWIYSFYRIIERAKGYLNDYIVKGCLVSFIVLYLQQSVELGLIASSPSILAYVILGLALGRVKYLKRQEVIYEQY